MEEQTDISEKRHEDISNLDVVDIQPDEIVLQSVDLNENSQKQVIMVVFPFIWLIILIGNNMC